MAEQINILGKSILAFLNYLTKLGTKKGRTDLWVLCIVFAFISCITGYIPCVQNNVVMTILIGMFSDLGISEFKSAFKTKDNGTRNKE